MCFCGIGVPKGSSVADLLSASNKTTVKVKSVRIIVQTRPLMPKKSTFCAILPHMHGSQQQTAQQFGMLLKQPHSPTLNSVFWLRVQPSPILRVMVSSFIFNTVYVCPSGVVPVCNLRALKAHFFVGLRGDKAAGVAL